MKKDRRQILVIEDNHDMRVCLRQTLENAGFSVQSAANGKDALTLLNRGINPHLIIVDLKMPIMSGEEFLAAKNQSWLAPIPTLIISGETAGRAEEKTEFLSKPLNWDELILRISMMVENRNKRTELKNELVS